MVNPEPEEPEGRPIHFGNLVFFALLVLSALLILLFWGWWRLWWLLPLGGGVWLFFFIVSLWEDRWRIVSPEDKARRGSGECPRCGNIVYFREKHSVGLRCKKAGCGVRVVTSYFPPIEEDRTEYALSMRPLGEAWKEKAARLAVRFELPLREAARLKGPEDVFVFRGRAPEVFRLREEMAVQGVAVSIEPAFPYEVYDPSPEGEFQPTEEQLDSLIQATKWMAEKEEKIPEVVYFLGFVVGAISSYAVASEWPYLLPAPGAAIWGGLAGWGGVYQRESIFRTLVWVLPVAGCWWIIITLLPVLRFWWVPILMVPTIVGAFAGVLVCNLWKAFVRQPPGDR